MLAFPCQGKLARVNRAQLMAKLNIHIAHLVIYHVFVNVVTLNIHALNISTNELCSAAFIRTPTFW